MDTYDVDCECCSQLVDVILVPAGVQPTPDTYVAVKS